MILTSDVCDRCNREPENILHALWNCSELAQIWEALPELSFHRTHSFSNISDLMLFSQREGKKIWRSLQCCYGQSGTAGTKSE